MTIYLDDRRRTFAQLITKLQHAVAGLPLLWIGIHKFDDESERLIATVEIAIAAAVLLTFLKELRAEHKHMEHAHPAVGWFDLAAALMLMWEAFHGEHTKPGYLRPPFLSGLVTLALGLFHGRFQHFLAHRRYLKIDDSGLDLRSSPLRRLKLQWAEISAIDLTAEKIVLRRRDGGLASIRLAWYRNADAIRTAFTEHPQAALLLEAPPS